MKSKMRRWSWKQLRIKIAEYGIRNSLLLAPMPTATTSQILGNNECFEPYTSNIYLRRVLSGEYIIMNQHLLNDLTNMRNWNIRVKNMIITNDGSIKYLDIPNSIKELYKTVWEIKQKHIIDMATDRAAFIDQSQSLNIHLAEPNYRKLTSLHFYTWRKGLKTGMYYLRTLAASNAIKYTIDPETLLQNKNHTISINNDKKVNNIEHETTKFYSPEMEEPCGACSG